MVVSENISCSYLDLSKVPVYIELISPHKGKNSVCDNMPMVGTFLLPQQCSVVRVLALAYMF